MHANDDLPSLDLTSPEFRRSSLAPVLVAAYRAANGKRRWSAAGVIFKLLRKLEGGPYHTATVRQLLRDDFQVSVGAYSYGDCLIPGAFPPQVVIGRFVSVGPGTRVYNQNHPLDHLSLHPYFYDPGMGVIDQIDMPRHTLVIGHDAWFGRNAIVTPGCKRVGIGAVIGAGAVVTKDVDDFAIVAGNPAKLIRYRFPETIRQSLIASRWWMRTMPDFKRFADVMNKPLTDAALNHPLLQQSA